MLIDKKIKIFWHVEPKLKKINFSKHFSRIINVSLKYNIMYKTRYHVNSILYRFKNKNINFFLLKFS